MNINKKNIILTYFIAVTLVYIIDLITTIIALNLRAVEANPIASYLFSQSILHVFGLIFFLASLMWGIVELVYLVLKKWIGEDLRFYAILLAVGLLIIFWHESLVIINNLNVISEMKGG